MKIDIERIKVEKGTRIRQEIGDLTKLQESIAQVGLINPILIDENDTLVAGFRRLSACKNLGWKKIEVKVVEFEGDELKMLEAEAAENFYRKEFTPDEILATERRRREIEEARRPKGRFERFWNWLKGLFGGKPKEPVATKPKPAVEEPQQTPEKEPPKEPEPEIKQEVPPQPEIKEEATPQPEVEPEEKEEESISFQPKAAEIIEKDGVRHIKWR